MLTKTPMFYLLAIDICLSKNGCRYFGCAKKMKFLRVGLPLGRGGIFAV